MDRADWIDLARLALDEFGTPFYLFSYPPVEERVAKLEKAIEQAKVATAVQQLLSLKTLPVPHLIQEWCKRGRGVEVVSETELSAALRAGVPNTHIVVNGVGKHHWLDAYTETGLTVNFDSLSEVRSLLPWAIERGWRLGLRVAVSPQIDPDCPDQPAQFGMSETDMKAAVRYVRSQSGDIQTLHFHLHSNVKDVSKFRVALDECYQLAQYLSIEPRFVDIGGGLPDFDVLQRNQGRVGPEFLPEYAQFLADASRRFVHLDALWIENGRYLLGPAGILVVSVIDTKWIRGRRFIICDGGRTNHAIESDWEYHAMIPVRETSGGYVPSTVCGPNCMAYDWVYKGLLPEEIREKDQLLYLNAGAYHLPWETRFSRGLCRVLWSPDGKTIKEIRAEESLEAVQAIWRL